MEWTAVDSEQQFCAAVLAATAFALEQRCRELTFCAPDFASWPLSDASLLTSLSGFLRLPGRQIVLLSQDFDVVKRVHPRFVAWRQVWSHGVVARRPVDDSTVLPWMLLADRALALELTDPEHWLGTWRRQPLERQAAIEKVEGLMRRTEAAFPVNVLGL